MTGKGKNGLTVQENLRNLRQQPVFEQSAEVQTTKCVAHPSKRMWLNPQEAVREAETRTITAKMPIVAYRCDECGNAHLCKAENARAGTVLERTNPERNWEVLPVVAGNREARQKLLMEYLVDHRSPSTDDLMTVMSVARQLVSTHMRALGWTVKRGPGARWSPPDLELEIDDEVDRFGKTEEEQVPMLAALIQPPPSPVDLAKRRHPSSQDVGWRPMARIDPIRHQPLGDVLDTLRSAGLEVRIMVREINE